MVLTHTQVKPFSSRDWCYVHVLVVPRRYSQPFGSVPKLRSAELWCWSSERDLRPLMVVQLDGALVAAEEGGAMVGVARGRDRGVLLTWRGYSAWGETVNLHLLFV